MIQPLMDACSIQKNDYQVAVLALFLSPRTMANVSVYGPDHHFQDQWLNIERCYLIFWILQSVLVVQSGGLRMEIGVLYLSHAMLVLAELTVCSTRGFACILAKWFWPTVMSLSLAYGSPKASCNKSRHILWKARC